jgi:hypothetical protein
VKLPPQLSEYINSAAFDAHWEQYEEMLIQEFRHVPYDKLFKQREMLDAARAFVEHVKRSSQIV